MTELIFYLLRYTMYINTANSTWFVQKKNIFNLKMSFYFY